MTDDERRERDREWQRRHYAAHQTQQLERSRRYYVAHREEVGERRWAHRQLFPAYRKAVAESSRRRQAACPEKVRQATRRYRARHPEKVREASQRRRARKLAAFVAPVDMREVFDRCRGRCHICGGKVRWDRAHPDALSKSIDHLVPLSLGGTHEPANVALAHLRCNVQRGAGRRPAQLWLIAS